MHASRLSRHHIHLAFTSPILLSLPLRLCTPSKPAATAPTHRPRSMSTSVPTIKLGTPPAPPSMPQLGLGLWKSPPDVTANIVEQALRAGYRHLDCACDYGNEGEVGRGIRAAISAGVCTRDDLFIASKLWNTYHARAHVRPALQRTLTDLGVGYVDCYMIHFPISLRYVPFEQRYPPEWTANGELEEVRVPIAETWAAMEELVEEGLTRHIGVCNFSAALLMDLLATAQVRPAVLQVELHPYLQQERLLELCRREGLAVTAFSPLGAGSYRELGMDRGDRVMDEEVLRGIAGRVGKSVAQVLLRWGVQRGCAVIPKTSKVERLKENMDVWDFALTEEDMREIGRLERGTRYNDPGAFCKGMGHSIPIYD